MICKQSFLFLILPFHFIVCFCLFFLLLCRSFLVWCSPMCLFLLLFPLPEETGLPVSNAGKHAACAFLWKFAAWGLALASLACVAFTFVHDVRAWISLFCMQLSSFFNIIYWRGFLFLIVYSRLLCHRLIDHRWMDSFLGFLFCSIDIYVYFCASTMLFWWM